jgi:hypothetical protein
MDSIFVACHMCGSYDSNDLIPAFLPDKSLCNFQRITICKKCGLVYKNPVIPELNKFSYPKSSWGDGSQFRKRIAELAQYLSENLSALNPKIIMEVGPGPGWLAIAVQKMYPTAKFLLLEASEEVAEITRQNMPSATIVPSAIDSVKLSTGFASLALVCGVDYLFTDFRNAIAKIHASIEDDGYLYIERNVFVESEAYAFSPIKTATDLFGQNPLMTTWFNIEQYQKFLELFFDIVSRKSFLHSEMEGHKCMIHGYLCRKKSFASGYFKENLSWYEANVNSLRRLA